MAIPLTPTPSATPLPSAITPPNTVNPPVQADPTAPSGSIASLASFIDDAHLAGYGSMDPSVIATVGHTLGNNNNAKVALAMIKQSSAIPNKTSQFLYEPSAVSPAQTTKKVVQDHFQNTGIAPMPAVSVSKLQQTLIDAKGPDGQTGTYAAGPADGVWGPAWTSASSQYHLDINSKPGVGGFSARNAFNAVFGSSFWSHAIPLVTSVIKALPGDALKGLGDGLKLSTDEIVAFENYVSSADSSQAKSLGYNIANWVSNVGHSIEGQPQLTDQQYANQSNWEGLIHIGNLALTLSTLGKLAESSVMAAKSGIAAGQEAGASSVAKALFTKVDPIAPHGFLNTVMNTVMPDTETGSRFAFTNWLKNSPSAAKMAPNLTAKVNAGLDATATDLKNSYQVARRVAATPYRIPAVGIAGHIGADVSAAGLKLGLQGHADNWMGDPNAPAAYQLDHLKPIAGLLGDALNAAQIFSHGTEYTGAVPLSDQVGSHVSEVQSGLINALNKTGYASDWERATDLSIPKVIQEGKAAGLKTPEYSLYSHIADQANKAAAAHAAQPFVDAARANETIPLGNHDAEYLYQRALESQILHDPKALDAAHESFIAKKMQFGKDIRASMLSQRQDPMSVTSHGLIAKLKNDELYRDSVVPHLKLADTSKEDTSWMSQTAQANALTDNVVGDGRVGYMRNEMPTAQDAQAKALAWAQDLQKAKEGYTAPKTLQGLLESSNGTDFGISEKYQGKIPKSHLPENETPAETALRNEVLPFLGNELGRNIANMKSVHTQDLIKLVAEKSKYLASDLEIPKFQLNKQPAYKNGPILFHGTSAKLLNGKLDDNVFREANRNLFGDGLYTTDNSDVAKSYMKKGSNNSPTTYSVKWNGAGTPKILDLNQPANNDLRSIFQEIANSGEDKSFLDKALNNPETSGRKLFSELREDYKANQNGDSAAEDFQHITQQLTDKFGYDALSHTGGVTKGNPHNVMIWLKPKDVTMSELNLNLEKSNQKLLDAIQKGKDAGYKPVIGHDIGNQLSSLPIDVSRMGGTLNPISRLLDKVGVNFTPTSDEASLSAISGKNGMQDVVEKIQAERPNEIPVWANASRLMDYAQNVISPDIGKMANKAINFSTSHFGKLLTLRGLDLSDGGAWQKELKNLMADGGWKDADGKIWNTEKLSDAKTVLKKILTSDSSPQAWLRKDFMKAMTDTGTNGMVKNKFGAEVEAVGMNQRDASDLWYGMQKGLRNAPAYQGGINPVSKMMNSSFGLANIPLQMNGRRVLDLLQPIQKSIIQARYLFSPRQAYLRVLKSALKGTNENMPYSMNPAVSFSDLPQEAQDAAKTLTTKVFGKPELDLNAPETQEYASSDYFNIFNPRATLERTVHYVSQNMTDAGKSLTTDAGIQELKNRVNAVNNYGERSAAEKTVNAFFFPFSFEKTVARELGGALLDNPSLRILTAGAIALYNSTDGKKMDKWLQDNVPLWKEVEKFNPFFHGVGIGQFGGINRVPEGIVGKALYGNATLPDFSTVSDADKLKLFVHMMQPKPLGGQASLKAAINLVPAVKDLNNIFVGYDPNGIKPIQPGGELVSSVRDLAHQANSAVHTFMGQDNPKAWEGYGYQPYDLQQTNAWNLRSKYITKLTPALQANQSGGSVTFLAGTPAVAGLRVNRSNIDKLVAQIYPKFDPNLQKYAAARIAGATTERVKILADVAKTGNTRLRDVYDSFVSSSDSIQSALYRDSLNPNLDTSAIAAATESMRAKARYLTENDPNFAAFYKRYYASKYGPLEGL